MSQQNDEDGCLSAIAAIVLIAVLAIAFYAMLVWMQAVSEALDINLVWQFGWPLVEVAP